MVLLFAEGLGQYEWVAGGQTANSDADIPHFVERNQPKRIFDFNAMTVATTALIGYTRDAPRMLFMDGVINGVERGGLHVGLGANRCGPSRR